MIAAILTALFVLFTIATERGFQNYSTQQDLYRVIVGAMVSFALGIATIIAWISEI